MEKLTQIKVAIAATALAIVLLLGFLLAPFRSPFELTRIRNSFLAESGAIEAFTWHPPNFPQEFLLESRSSPFFDSAVQNVAFPAEPPATAWDKAVAIAKHLTTGPGTGDGIGSTSDVSYRQIITDERGHCSDYTQVFNALALEAGIAVREWGMTVDGFGGQGHAVNEVYDPEYDKWMMIDSFRSLYVVDPETRIPLSMLEFRDRLLWGHLEESIAVVPIAQERFKFPNSSEALEYYRAFADELFLWFGNNVFSYDSHPVVRIFSPFPRAVEQAAAIAAGIHPRFRIVESETNSAMINNLHRVRKRFLRTTAALLILLAVLSFEVLLYMRHRGRWVSRGSVSPS